MGRSIAQSPRYLTCIKYIRVQQCRRRGWSEALRGHVDFLLFFRRALLGFRCRNANAFRDSLWSLVLFLKEHVAGKFGIIFIRGGEHEIGGPFKAFQ